MQVGKGSAYGTLLHHITPSRSPHNALHSPSWASVSEPHTSELNRDFSSNIIIGASVSEPPSSDANGDFLYIYILYIYIIYYVSYVVPHILNLSNLTHVTSIKYV